MIDLNLRTKPYELELLYGLKVTVKPLTTAGVAAAQAAARRAVEAIERQARERTEAGLALDGLPDLSPEGERHGFYQAQLIRELAVRQVTGWTGVELSSVRAPPTPENIAAVMEFYPVGERFFQEFTLRQVLLNATKNGFGPSAAGTSSRAEGPNTAKPAGTRDYPVPEASPEPTASFALPRARLDQPAGARGLGSAGRLPGSVAVCTDGARDRHRRDRSAEDWRHSGLQSRGPLGAAVGCGGGFGGGVVPDPGRGPSHLL